MGTLYSLQKLCDVLAEHPSWTLAHLAVHFALHDTLNNPTINSFLNSSDEATGISPLQVAIMTHNLKTIQMLVNANCSLEHIDFEVNSVYHYAANSTKDIVLVSVF